MVYPANILPKCDDMYLWLNKPSYKVIYIKMIMNTYLKCCQYTNYKQHTIHRYDGDPSLRPTTPASEIHGYTPNHSTYVWCLFV